MATGFGDVQKAAFPTTTEILHGTKTFNFDATKVLSGARILFGAVFLFDGLLKWWLFSQGQMYDVISGFGYDFLTNNWVLVGAVVGVGETLAGIALLVGLFQKPAAVAAAAIMFAIWGFGGYNGWGQAGYTDPGGDLMLGLTYLVLLFAPTAYGIASRLKLPERWGTSSLSHRLLRFLIA